jgi:hypothetical protein
VSSRSKHGKPWLQILDLGRQGWNKADPGPGVSGRGRYLVNGSEWLDEAAG